MHIQTRVVALALAFANRRSQICQILASLPFLLSFCAPARADDFSSLRCHQALHREQYAAPFEQYLLWLEQANTEHFRQSTDFFALEFAEVDPATVNVIAAADVAADIARRLGIGASHLLAPKHPFNTNPGVPFFNLPTRATMRARFTASRSLVVWPEDGHPFSIKMGTNFPHQCAAQDKTDLCENIRVGFARSQHVRRVDEVSKPAEHLIILREVLTVADASGNGYLVRDLRPLLDGHYYLPAFAIPYVGQGIAARFNASFADFWGEHYAEALGKAKAEFALRYKLQFDQANAQNIVLQLDKDMRPTGKFVFFDLGDTSVTTALTTDWQWSEFNAENASLGKQNRAGLNPDWMNSNWQMDKGGLDPAVARAWGTRHDRAYLMTLDRELGPIPPPRTGRDSLQSPTLDVRQWTSAIEGYLLSTFKGREAGKRYDQRIRLTPAETPVH